ncbi:titin homolog [Bolinopsis microptera]|uniref:titin homolog n=1 Tax=Bolinopsis microptera TaxID=2820187 RepID=UPI0030791167
MLPLVFVILWMGISSADIPLDLVPVIVEAGPGTVSLISGDTMILSCIVRAYPPPTAKIIKLSEDSFNSVDNEDDIELDFDITSNNAEDTLIEVTLTQLASVEDSGWYRCRATNPHGEAHEDYYVEVFENEATFYGTGELVPILPVEINDLLDDLVTDPVTDPASTTPELVTTGPLTTETEASEEVSSPTPYYMRLF